MNKLVLDSKFKTNIQKPEQIYISCFRENLYKISIQTLQSCDFLAKSAVNPKHFFPSVDFFDFLNLHLS